MLDIPAKFSNTFFSSWTKVSHCTYSFRIFLPLVTSSDAVLWQKWASHFLVASGVGVIKNNLHLLLLQSSTLQICSSVSLGSTLLFNSLESEEFLLFSKFVSSMSYHFRCHLPINAFSMAIHLRSSRSAVWSILLCLQSIHHQISHNVFVTFSAQSVCPYLSVWGPVVGFFRGG